MGLLKSIRWPLAGLALSGVIFYLEYTGSYLAKLVNSTVLAFKTQCIPLPVISDLAS